MIAVVFTKNNARVLSGPAAELVKNNKNVVIDPDLTAVSGIPPHYWKLFDNKVLPMTSLEIAERDLSIKLKGIDNTVVIDEPKKDKDYGSWLFWSVLVALLVGFIYLKTHH